MVKVGNIVQFGNKAQFGVMSDQLRVSLYMVMGQKVMNKTNHPISSNSHPKATANIAINCLKMEGAHKTNGNII